MKTVLDEGVPRQLAAALRSCGIDAHEFPREWRGLANGRLLTAMEQKGFGCILTNDRNIASQQNLKGRKLTIVALPTNRLSKIIPRAGDIADTIRLMTAAVHVQIDLDGTRIQFAVDENVTLPDLPPLQPFT